MHTTLLPFILVLVFLFTISSGEYMRGSNSTWLFPPLRYKLILSVIDQTDAPAMDRLHEIVSCLHLTFSRLPQKFESNHQ